MDRWRLKRVTCCKDSGSAMMPEEEEDRLGKRVVTRTARVAALEMERRGWIREAVVRTGCLWGYLCLFRWSEQNTILGCL